MKINEEYLNINLFKKSPGSGLSIQKEMSQHSTATSAIWTSRCGPSCPFTLTWQKLIRWFPKSGC